MNAFHFLVWILKLLSIGGTILSLSSSRSFASEEKGTASTSHSHRISPEIPTLGEISRYLYGKARWYKRIARWNHIAPPYKVYIGQNLILKEAPTLTPEEGRNELTQMWKRLGLNRRELPSNHPDPSNPSEVGDTTLRKEPIRPEIPTKVKEDFETSLRQAKEEETHENPKQVNALDRFHEGVVQFQAGKFQDALVSFRSSREIDPSPLPPWLYELRTLKTLGDLKSAKETADLFVQHHPDAALRSLPLVKWALEGAP